MQITRGARHKNLLGKLGGAFGGRRIDLPDHDIELRRTSSEGLEAGVVPQAPIEFARSPPAADQAAGKVALGLERQKLLRGPQGDGCSASSRALQADFAQVQFL